MGTNYKKITKICLICKKEFIPSRTEYMCCSVKCGKVWSAQKGGKTGYFKREVECDHCKTKLLRGPYKLKKNVKNFCSRQCYWLFQKESLKGNNNPNYSYGGHKKVCPTCGKEFITYHKKKRYCSYRCVKTINLFYKGRRFEWKARDNLKKQGYTVIRSAGSKTNADLIAIRKDRIIIIQVKATLNITTKVERLFSNEIQELRNMEAPPFIFKEFWVWRDRKGWSILRL